MLQILSQLRTPVLLCDLDQLQTIGVDPETIGSLPADARAEILKDALFLHARVSSIAESTVGFHRDSSLPLATIDCKLPRGGAYLSTGLNNAWDPNYFWARATGSGARRLRTRVDKTSLPPL